LRLFPPGQDENAVRAEPSEADATPVAPARAQAKGRSQSCPAHFFTSHRLALDLSLRTVEYTHLVEAVWLAQRAKIQEPSPSGLGAWIGGKGGLKARDSSGSGFIMPKRHYITALRTGLSNGRAFDASAMCLLARPLGWARESATFSGLEKSKLQAQGCAWSAATWPAAGGRQSNLGFKIEPRCGLKTRVPPDNFLSHQFSRIMRSLSCTSSGLPSGLAKGLCRAGSPRLKISGNTTRQRAARSRSG
jgi:hypothetical protein